MARRPDDQRHAQALLVEARVVEPDAVLAERFTVIGGDEEDRARREAEALDLCAQGANLLIDVAHLARILRGGKARVAHARQPVGEIASVGEPAADRAAEVGDASAQPGVGAPPVEPGSMDHEPTHPPAAEAELALQVAHVACVLLQEGADPAEIVEEPAEGRIDCAAVSRVAWVAGVVGAVVRGRRNVRHVGVPVVEPGEERLPAGAPEPAEEAGVRLGGAQRDGDLLRGTVALEAMEERCEWSLRAEVLGAHECGRAVASLDEQPGQYRDRPRRRARIVQHAMLGERERAQDAQVRGHRDGRLGPGLDELHTLGRQPVEVRRSDRGAAVAADVIGAQRVDGDQHDVRPSSSIARRAVDAAADCEGEERE